MPDTSNRDPDNLLSTVNLRLLDPLGKSIAGLKYHILQQGKIIAKGVTAADGCIASFVSEIGAPLSLHVARFASDEMKKIKTLVPWAEDFSVKLLSGKVKQELPLAKDDGAAGEYKRKTYIVKSHDTLAKIAANNGTTAQAIAKLNNIPLSAIIHPEQVLKLPPDTRAGAATAAPSAPAAAAQTSTPTTKQAPPAKPPTNTPPSAKAPADSVPVPTQTVDERGQTGTPKTTVAMECDRSGCIKLGDKGPLIEEINIRLTGFGGTVLESKSWDEFTSKTESAVKQFQRDYMGVSETGKVCGNVLAALDDFRQKYPISLADMKCRCGACGGFGNSQSTSAQAKMVNASKQPYPGIEYPGMHRGLLWGFRAALFYIAGKDKQLDYHFLRISSGYRCWLDNKAHNRLTTNHMGNALDIQFRKGAVQTRCAGADVDKLRKDVFIGRLGAQMNWPDSNKLSMEPASLGATSWVHVDVREFDDAFKKDRYYATTQAMADGAPLLEAARLEGRLKLVNCGGIPQKPAQEKTDRIPMASLSLSQAGLDFIKGWEKYGEYPYDDSENYCTVGWGHLIAKQTCASLAAAKDPRYEKYKNGVSGPQAEAILKNDVSRITDKVALFVQVPLYQQEYDALVSLAFNTGGFSKFPKLLSKLNTKDYNGCCDEFADITNKGTSGLVKRRKAEMKIFRNNVYDSSH
ncbi:LysM peptidoglycan-binding domain-containing protein [Rugamonas sp. A1-17]|nr:LysM peptidoglycan-binding domain-containing protein [Rugamonas sp. A1-17]